MPGDRLARGRRVILTARAVRGWGTIAHREPTARARTKEPDEACAQAVDLARGAAEEMAGSGRVGEHLGVTADGDRVVTHLFRCLDPAYHGWCWAITVARASRAKTRDRQREPPGARAGGDPRPGLGALAGTGAAR